MELEESTRGDQEGVMLEWGLWRLPYFGGRQGRGGTGAQFLALLCHVAARQASLEQASAALLSPAAVIHTRNQDSSVMLSLTLLSLILRKAVLLSFHLPATALLLLITRTLQGSEPPGEMWSPAERCDGRMEQGALWLLVS